MQETTAQFHCKINYNSIKYLFGRPRPNLGWIMLVGIWQSINKILKHKYI